MLNQMLKKTVERFPKKTAVVCGESRITYQELYNKVERFSQGLTSIGVKPSECVALILPNCPEFVISFYGIARIGAIALFLNPSFKESELEQYISDSNAIAIVTDLTRAETCSHLISKLDRQVQLVVVGGEERSSLTFDDVLAREVETFQQEQFHEADVLYQYSSGSTGKPKRVCRTQNNIFHEANNCFLTQEITESDKIFCLVPLYHAYGFGQCLLAATHSGATLVILEPCLQNGRIIEQPFIVRQARVLEAIAQEKITILPAVPYIYSVLAAIPSTTPVDLSTLRLCISAGNFLPKDIFDKLYARFGIAIRQLYGCTEAGAVAINMQSGADFKYDSIGLPMKNVEIKIIDEAEKELPPGVVGEVAIKSKTLTRGYDNVPDANREAFKNGYFLTGDLGKKDESGYLYITGRKKFLIDTGGYKVDPFEVEAVLAKHPKISEVVVVGVSDAHAGQLVKAVVVPKGECREQDIFDYCQDKLAEFKIPKIVGFRQEIPKSSLGKILREKLVTESANLSQNLALKAKVQTQHNRSCLKSVFVPPRNHLEQKLVKIWENVLNISPVGVQDNFFELGLNSIDAMRIANRLQEELQLIFHVAVLLEEPTIEKFANYLQKNYSKLIQTIEGTTDRQTVESTEKLNVQKIERMRQYLLHFHSGESIQSNKSERKNKQAIFILCPPRSGSTLLRVMLAGHPQLFAPPELYLLSFNTLAERKTAFSERNRLFTEGLIRAIMEIKNCDSEQARQIIEELEEQNLDTKRFFSLMQEWLSDKILVDQTPLYAFNPQVLQRAEEEFENPLYIHLLRYPLASIHSMEQIRFDLLVGMTEESDDMSLSVKQKGELMWLISQKNILEFLKNVPRSRQHQVKYEDLVQQTQTTVNRLCKFIGVDFHADMLQPYQEKKRRMTDGIDSVSRMMGDPKFHTHKSIDAEAANRWKENYQVDFLAEDTWQVAEYFGYERINIVEKILKTGVGDREEINFNTEVVLAPTIIPQTTISRNFTNPQKILLTGATGFVGIYLLDELLEQTSANIYCLIRAKDLDSAKQKLQSQLKYYLLWEEEKMNSRIIPLVGDLSSKFLGLSTETFNYLAHHIDAIYHSGAWVNHIYPFTVLKSTNVLGTQEILRLASKIHVKPVHFISTLGVLSASSNPEGTIILESDPLTEIPKTENGYIQSKWVAEKLVMEGRNRGIPICIYRMPMITGNTETGASNINDRVCRQIKGCIQLGMVPILEYQLADNWIPVNEISQAIVHLSQQKESLGKEFHLQNPIPTSYNNFFDWIYSLDYSVKKVSLNEFTIELFKHSENVLYPYLLELVRQLNPEKKLKITSQSVSDRNTKNGLASSNIIFSTVDKKYLEKKYLYLKEKSFL